MKINQEKSFQPITIVIETEAEARQFANIMNAADPDLGGFGGNEEFSLYSHWKDRTPTHSMFLKLSNYFFDIVGDHDDNTTISPDE